MFDKLSAITRTVSVIFSAFVFLFVCWPFYVVIDILDHVSPRK